MLDVRPAGPPTVVDRLYRAAYRCAYLLMRVYWQTLHPSTHGALVALWWQERILLVRQSYVPYLSLPGGYVHPGESALLAAVRELREETGFTVSPEQLRPVLDRTHDWQGKRDHVEIFELEVTEPPRLRIDNREVIEAMFLGPQEALAQDLFPLIRDVIARRMARRTTTTTG